MDDLAYRLTLELRADALEYSAHLVISARALPSTLKLDTIGHTVRAVTVGDRAVPFDHAPTGNALTIPALPPGTTSLAVDYSGVVDDRGVRGFYASPMGSGRFFSTYFEPASARRLLPCIDRPDAKARFTVEVTAPREWVVVSNTPAATSQDAPDGRRTTRFATTPPMSTYLLFVGMGTLEEIEGTRTDPRVIVGAPPGRTEAGRYALDVATRAVDYFASYYQEPYPLPKLHLIAIPQFGTGAMENWGAIAFQEYVLLLDPTAPVSTKVRLVEVVCHEVAHQWFGDLVTMRWWNDLWLNEAFASFVAAKASDQLLPEGSAWDDFLLLRYAGSMLWDALPHTHPVRVDVAEPEQIRQIFDEISYGKGASVLRMAEAYVGESAFRRGVSRYLSAHRWGNAEAGDLWRAVAEAAGENVERVFADWVGRPGFPLVTARRSGEQLVLDQERFALLDPIPDRPWPIPLSVRVGATTHRELFDRERTTLPVGTETPVVNPGRTGYYRVRYEGELRREILDRFGGLPPVDRWAVVNDGLALLLAGRTDLAEYLELFGRLAQEDDPFVVGEVVATSRLLFPVVHRIPRWKAALTQVVAAQSERLGLLQRDGETVQVRALRELMNLVRVRLDPAFAARLATQYPDYDTLEPELARPVLAAYASRAGESEYAELRRRLAAATTVDAKRAVAGALGNAPRDPWVREGLEMILTGELYLGPWIELYGTALVYNPERSAAVWSFLVDRGETMAKFAAGTSNMGILLQGSIPLLGLARPDEMRAWLDRVRMPETSRAVTKGRDLLELYLRLIARAQ